MVRVQAVSTPGYHLSFAAPSVRRVSSAKQTALGKGYFITMSQDVTDQHGELVRDP